MAPGGGVGLGVTGGGGGGGVGGGGGGLSWEGGTGGRVSAYGGMVFQRKVLVGRRKTEESGVLASRSGNRGEERVCLGVR